MTYGDEYDYDEGPDLSTCPYYARYYDLDGHDPEGICSFGCVDEPACITSFPPP